MRTEALRCYPCEVKQGSQLAALRAGIGALLDVFIETPPADRAMAKALQLNLLLTLQAGGGDHKPTQRALVDAMIAKKDAPPAKPQTEQDLVEPARQEILRQERSQ
jgi:hypothetical protein